MVVMAKVIVILILGVFLLGNTDCDKNKNQPKLKPPTTAPVVPEPVSSVLFVTGAGILWLARRSKR